MKWIFTIALLAAYVPFPIMGWIGLKRGYNPVHVWGYLAVITFVVVYRWYTKVWRV